MSRKYFGTDGIRGVANSHPMTVEVALKVGQAAGTMFRQQIPHARPTVVIGKDTRLSGYMVESALQAGFTSVGFYCLLVGPMPTPGVSYLTRSLRADLGVMISASHNKFTDNGIKIFGPDGFKLPDSVEMDIEALIDGTSSQHIELAEADNIGKAIRVEDAVGRYMESCKMSVSKDFSLEGVRLVVDCAHGAAYQIAPKILWELGAEVIRIGCEPDGYNINHNCGATSPNALRKAVIAQKADLGIALDGDADRLILCDENGNILDGDQIMGAIGTYLHSENLLKGNGVVATQMSNMGLEKYLNEHDIDLLRTNVGDRYVMEAMRKQGYNFGGEASGHLIFLDHATTGDGSLAALKFLEVLKMTGQKASELGHCFKPFPQKLHNIVLPERDMADAILDVSDVKDAIRKSEDSLAGSGRVLIRKSGTEPLIRVMVEAEKQEQVDAEVAALADVMEAQIAQL